MYYRAAADSVVFVVLDFASLGISAFAFAYFLKRRALYRLKIACPIFRYERSPSDIGDISDAFSLSKPRRYLARLPLAHPVNEQVGLRVEQYGTAHPVVPVVVVRKTAKRCLESAYYYRRVRKCLPRAVCVNYRRPVRAEPDPVAGTVKVLAPASFGDSVVRHHRIYVSAAYHHRVSWLSHG
ncbi:hypothetical protein SDC9_147416 [bioreactor metagenome]|uniref:Uncharacterized protein n=1 Tax=bioreactor metagenome TaxID=1076179 RepID=A0A645EG09_9ZZZZ